MKKEEFRFASKDGKSSIYAVRYIPDTPEICAVVQIVHGMAEYVERYEGLAEFLTQRGILVTGADQLGHGKTLGEGDIPGYICEENPAEVLVEDVHSLRTLTQELYPQLPYVLLGHSMGSFIVRNYICQYGEGLSGAVIMGTNVYDEGTVKWGLRLLNLQKALFGSKHVSKLLNWIVFGSNNKNIPHPRTEVDWLSKDEAVIDRYVADPLCGFLFTINGFDALFHLIYSMDDFSRMGVIPKELPILLLSGAKDPVGEFGKGVKKARRYLRVCGVKDVRYKLYPEGRHEILQDAEKAEVSQDLYDWMKESVLSQQ